MQARMAGRLRFRNHPMLGGWGGDPSYSSTTALLGTWGQVIYVLTLSPVSSSLQKAACCLRCIRLVVFLWRLPTSMEDWPLHSPSPAPWWCFPSTLCQGPVSIACTCPAPLCVDWLSLICSKSCIIKHRQIYFLFDWHPKYLQTSRVPFDMSLIYS